MFRKCKHHIDHITIKISRTIGLISKLRHLVPKHTLINIYRSLIAPNLNYGLIVWGQARKSYIGKLLKLQKRALRFIYFSDRNQHAIPLFSDTGILPPQFSYYELTANLMFDIRHRNAPINIRDLFQDISNIHPYNTRSSASHNFYTQSSRLSIQLNSFSRIGTKIWNEMPLSLRNLSKHDFKKKKLEVYFSIFCLWKTPILIYETSFKRSNFLKLLTYFQNNKYSLNGIIVVFLFYTYSKICILILRPAILRQTLQIKH